MWTGAIGWCRGNMRILIHAVSIQKTGGSTRHLAGFIPALTAAGPDHQFLVCLNAEFAQRSRFQAPNLQVLPIHVGTALERLWWDQVRLPRLVAEHRVDVVLALLSFGCVWPWVKQVVFERNPIYFCDYYLEGLSWRQRLATALRRSLIRATMHTSKTVVTPSAAMRDMIRRYCPEIPIEKFVVLPHAFDLDGFRRAEPLPAAVEEAMHDGDGVRVLYVSHLMPHKGFRMLLPTAKHLADRGWRFRFLVTGDRADWPEGYDTFVAEMDRLGLRPYVALLGRVPEEAVANLYLASDIFFFPSSCESFGFPMVEALGLGLPIVAADTPVNREICGEAALHYPPRDPIAAAEQLSRLFVDPELRIHRAERSQRQYLLEDRSWKRYADRCLQLLG